MKLELLKRPIEIPLSNHVVGDCFLHDGEVLMVMKAILLQTEDEDDGDDEVYALYLTGKLKGNYYSFSGKQEAASINLKLVEIP